MTNAEAFAARLARIESGGPNTNRTIFVGQDEQVHLGKKVHQKQSASKQIVGNAIYPLSLIGAFGLGLLAVSLGYYARFQLMAGQAELEDADLEMAISGVIGMALSFILAQMFRLTSKEHKAMQGAGVFVMVCAFHNFAHWAPGPMTALFSPEWVAQIRADAPPNSARFRGLYIPLFDKGSAVELATSEVVAEPETQSGAKPATVACAATKPEVKRIQLDNAKKTVKPAKTAACEGG